MLVMNSRYRTHINCFIVVSEMNSSGYSRIDRDTQRDDCPSIGQGYKEYITCNWLLRVVPAVIAEVGVVVGGREESVQRS